jgi:hypothetical protein
MISQKGSTIVAYVPGLGTEDENVTLANSANGEDICQSAKIISYGMLECITKEIDAAA